MTMDVLRARTTRAIVIGLLCMLSPVLSAQTNFEVGRLIAPIMLLLDEEQVDICATSGPVSYTHLTLPTT